MEPKKQGGPYQFTTNQNHQDFSSGRVLYGATGSSNFPVRLASEIFLRAVHILKSQGNQGPYIIYDPFCGAGYSVTVLGFLHSSEIKTIFASDEDMLGVAKKNLSLLTRKGLADRVEELGGLEAMFHKTSHRYALESSERLEGLLPQSEISVQTFQHNVLTDLFTEFDLSQVDLVITDLPYGKLNQWEGLEFGQNPAQEFLSNLRKGLKPLALLALSANKEQEIEYHGFTKAKAFKLGVRKILFLQPEDQS